MTYTFNADAVAATADVTLTRAKNWMTTGDDEPADEPWDSIGYDLHVAFGASPLVGRNAPFYTAGAQAMLKLLVDSGHLNMTYVRATVKPQKEKQDG